MQGQQHLMNMLPLGLFRFVSFLLIIFALAWFLLLDCVSRSSSSSFSIMFLVLFFALAWYSFLSVVYLLYLYCFSFFSMNFPPILFNQQARFFYDSLQTEITNTSEKRNNYIVTQTTVNIWNETTPSCVSSFDVNGYYGSCCI